MVAGGPGRSGSASEDDGLPLAQTAATAQEVRRRIGRDLPTNARFCRFPRAAGSEPVRTAAALGGAELARRLGCEDAG
jgi:hypothetical protein